MENLKYFFTEIYEVLKPLLLIAVYIALFGFFMSGFIFFNIKIDTSNLDKIRHCPSCGIDLLDGF